MVTPVMSGNLVTVVQTQHGSCKQYVRPVTLSRFIATSSETTGIVTLCNLGVSNHFFSATCSLLQALLLSLCDTKRCVCCRAWLHAQTSVHIWFLLFLEFADDKWTVWLLLFLKKRRVKVYDWRGQVTASHSLKRFVKLIWVVASWLVDITLY